MSKGCLNRHLRGCFRMSKVVVICHCETAHSRLGDKRHDIITKIIKDS